MGDEPEARQDQLPPDVRPRHEERCGDWAKETSREPQRDGKRRKACDRASQREEKSRREKLPQRDARSEDAQKTHPCRRLPAVTPADPEHDDVRKPRFDPRNGKRNRGLRNGKGDRRGAPARDAAVFCGGGEVSVCGQAFGFAIEWFLSNCQS